MVLWLNGGYGAGKSAVAREIRRRIPGVVRFDAEQVGNAVRDNLQTLVYHEEFPAYPQWRRFVAEMLLALGRVKRVVVPMTVLNKDDLAEIFSALDQGNVPWRHVVLDVPVQELRRRILLRGETEDCWCMRQRERCAALLSDLPGTHVAAVGPLDAVVNAVLNEVGWQAEEDRGGPGNVRGIAENH